MKYNSYIVASLGRCGSQLMTVALHNHIWGFLDHPKPFLKKTRPFIREYPETFRSKVVHKTHLYPIEYPKDCKLIFTFGNPLDIVLSVIKKSREPGWGSAHFKNLDADWQNYPRILQEDVLRLERMFDAFYQEQTCDTICLRYEDLWDNQKKISDFLNFDFKLPEKKERDATVMRDQLSEKQIQEFNQGYSSIIKKINNADSCKIWSIK